MRRTLITSLFIILLAGGAAGAAPAAHAAPPANCADGDGTVGSPCCGNDKTYCGPNLTCNTTTYVCESLSDSSVAPQTGGKDNPIVGQDQNAQYNSVMIWIMSLFAWLVGVAAITLDYAVYYTVVMMGDYVHKLSGVGVAWRVLRDFANIMLIFGFLGAGIMTILDIDLYGWSTKMLPKLLIAAVLINFSLFISEAMIDGTNLISTEIYTQINGGTLPTTAPNSGLTATLSGAGLKTANEGISNKIMNQLGLQTLYGNGNTAVFDVNHPWLVGFMGILLFITTAFVMFSLAFILIARFVALILLILVSPVAFMGWAVPWLEYRMDQWWEHFTKQIITAPVLLLLLYVALLVITDAQFLTGFGKAGTGGATGFIENQNLPGFASFILSFLVAIGLLLVVVIKAKSMSAVGANLATKAAGKLTFGATAFVGRRTIGRASNASARFIRSSAFGRSDMGKLFAGIADKGAKASFDVRGAKAFGELGINAGVAQKGGYHGREEELMKSRIDYAKTLRQTSAERTASEQASDVKDKLVEAHNAKMEPLQKQEQEQLRKIKAATTKEEKEAARDEIEITRNQIALEKNDHQTKLSEQDAIIKKNSSAAAQKQYGEALRKKTVFGGKEDNGIPRFPYDWPTAVGSARRESSSRIIGEANKDPSMKKLEEIENMLAKANKAVPPSTPPTPSTPSP